MEILNQYLKEQEKVIADTITELDNNKLILLNSYPYLESDLTFFIFLNQDKLYINFGYGYPIWDDQNKGYTFNKDRPVYIIDYIYNILYINNQKIVITDYESLFFLISQHWFESYLSNGYNRKGYLWDEIKSKEAQYTQLLQLFLSQLINEVKNG